MRRWLTAALVLALGAAAAVYAQTTGIPIFQKVKLTDLTASRLLATDSVYTTESTSLASWIAGGSGISVVDDGDGSVTISASAAGAVTSLTGTANQILVNGGVGPVGGAITLTLPQNVHTAASPTFASATLTGLLASRLMATSAGNAAVSVSDLTSWIAGTANRVTVANDGDGTVTLSGPQDLHTAATPTFEDLTLTGGATVGFSGAITDDAVQVGDANFHLWLNPTGTHPTFSFDSNDYAVYYRTAVSPVHANELLWYGNGGLGFIQNLQYGGLNVGGVTFTWLGVDYWITRQLEVGGAANPLWADTTQRGTLFAVRGTSPDLSGTSATGQMYKTPQVYVERWDASTITDSNLYSPHTNSFLAAPVLIEVVETGSGYISPAGIVSRVQNRAAPPVDLGSNSNIVAGAFVGETLVGSGGRNRETWGLGVVASWQPVGADATGLSPVNLVGIEADIISNVGDSNTSLVTDTPTHNYTGYWAQADGTKILSTGLYVSNTGSAKWRWGQVTNTNATEWLAWWKNRETNGQGLYIEGLASTTTKSLLEIQNNPGGGLALVAKVTGDGLLVAKGANIGFTSSAPVDDVLAVGDANFHLDAGSGTPRLVFDSGDQVLFARSTNTYTFQIASGSELVLTASGLTVSDGVTIGTTTTPVASTLIIGANAAGAGTVRLANNASIYWRNGANSADLEGLVIDGSNLLKVGFGATDIAWGKALVALGGGAAPTLGTIGGTGPTVAAQNSWMRVVDTTGAAFWVPVWK